MKVKLIQDLSHANPNLTYGRTIEVELKDDGVYFGNTRINDLCYYWDNPSEEEKKKIEKFYNSKQKQQIADGLNKSFTTYIPTRRIIEVPEGVKKVTFIFEE